MSKPPAKTTHAKRKAQSVTRTKNSKNAQPKQDGRAAWNSFRDRFPELPFFGDDATYAIPEPLIQLIDEKVELFTPKEKEFELTLSSDAGLGFVFEMLMPLNVVTRELAPGYTPRGEAWECYVQRDREIQESLGIDLVIKGISQSHIETLGIQEQSISKKLDESSLAYVGWLATNSEFRGDLERLRTKWQNEIKNMRHFPRVEVSYFGEEPWQPGNVDPVLNEDFLMLYRKWCLESLATWDLPIPLQTHLLHKWFPAFRLNQSEAASTRTGADEESLKLQDFDSYGFTVFIPWYLFRDKTVDIQEVAAHQLTINSHKHLEGWIDKRPKNWGLDRSLKLLKLFVYFELALKRRYGARLKSVAGKLDEVFAIYFSGKQNADPENIKKIRLEMKKRLRGQSRS